MAGRIPQRDIEQIKQRISIADVVGEYVQLKSSGVGSLKGLCPFHDEKSPSFNLRGDQGFYHCFGCGEGGDVYKFLQKMENITFYEAVEKCAAKISYQITYESGGRDDGVNRARLLAANEAAAKFFSEQLNSTEAQEARNFLSARNFDKSSAEHFGVGYAPKSWTALSDHLKAQGFTEEELIKVDLLVAKEGKRYDKFRGRLIWPIRDATNSVVGFGARKIYEDDPLAKYINTSETPVYHKSQVLYGLDLAKKEIVQNRQVVVVEGYTDVMACHLAGIKTAVATCGTAFGDDHIRKINQLFGSSDQAASVIFTFDPDAAGQKAAMRAFESSAKFIATTFVATGPEGLDPCDLRIKQGDQAVVQMIQDRRPIYEFALDQKISGHDLTSYPGRLAAATAAVSVLARLSDLGAREQYVRILAAKVQLSADEINRLLSQELTKQRSQAVQASRRGDYEPVAPEQVDEQPEFPTPNLNDPNTRFEQEVLAVLLQLPSAWKQEQLHQVCGELFATVSFSVIAQAIKSATEGNPESSWIDRVLANSPEPLHSMIRAFAVKPLPVTSADQAKDYAEGVISSALKKILVRNRAAMISALALIDKESYPDQHSKVQRDLVALEEKIRALS